MRKLVPTLILLVAVAVVVAAVLASGHSELGIGMIPAALIALGLRRKRPPPTLADQGADLARAKKARQREQDRRSQAKELTDDLATTEKDKAPGARMRALLRRVRNR